MIAAAKGCAVAILTCGIAGCATQPTMDASGCANIQGVIAKEFRLDLSGSLKTPVSSHAGGLNLFWGPMPMTQEHRDLLVIGDQLCHEAALEPPLVTPKFYREFMAALVGGLSREAIDAGANPAKVADIRRDVARAAVVIGEQPEPDAKAVETFMAASDPARVPPSDPLKPAKDLTPAPNLTDANYRALSARVDDLGTQVGALRTIWSQPGVETLGHVTFDLNSAELDEAARHELEGIVKAAGPDAGYRVEGYADSTGGYALNGELSLRRAEAVAAFLRSLGAKQVVSVVGQGRTDVFGQMARENRRVVVQRVAFQP